MLSTQVSITSRMQAEAAEGMASQERTALNTKLKIKPKNQRTVVKNPGESKRACSVGPIIYRRYLLCLPYSYKILGMKIRRAALERQRLTIFYNS